MKNIKKYLAVALAATMAVGSSVTALASGGLATPSVTTPSDITDPDKAEGTIGGDIKFEGTIDEDVFHIVVPTIENKETYYSFILDPEQLISRTNGGSLETATYEDGATLFFRTTDATTTYQSSSEKFKIENKSTMDVDVTFSAVLENLGNDITMSENNTFKDSENKDVVATSIYLGIVKDGGTAVAVDADGTSVTAQIGKAPAGAYKEFYKDGKYSMELDPDASPAPTFSSSEFNLTGASNPNGDWSEVDFSKSAPKLKVTWKVVPHTTKPSIATKTYKMTSGQPVVVDVNLGVAPDNATDITSITYAVDTETRTLATSNYSFDATTKKLTINGTYITDVLNAGVTSRAYTITFNDTAKTKVVITLTN